MTKRDGPPKVEGWKSLDPVDPCLVRGYIAEAQVRPLVVNSQSFNPICLKCLVSAHLCFGGRVCVMRGFGGLFEGVFFDCPFEGCGAFEYES